VAHELVAPKYKMEYNQQVIRPVPAKVGAPGSEGRDSYCWITRHPEVTLGSLGEFEMCPDWAPAMNTGRQFARIALKTMGDHGFDHRAN